MDINIKKMEICDKYEIVTMMEKFYSSNAVSTNGSNEIFNNNVDNCISDNPYIEGYTICINNEIAGYTMLSKSYSTEFAKKCVWIEDLYLKPDFRGQGIIPKVIDFIKEKYKENILKLEVEEENAHAVHVYQKTDFKKLPYFVMMYKNKKDT